MGGITTLMIFCDCERRLAHTLVSTKALGYKRGRGIFG